MSKKLPRVVLPTTPKTGSLANSQTFPKKLIVELVEELKPVIQRVIQDSFSGGYFSPEQLEARLLAAFQTYLANISLNLDIQRASNASVAVAKDVGPIILTAQLATKDLPNNDQRTAKRFNLIQKMVNESVYNNTPISDFRKKQAVADSVNNELSFFTAVKSQLRGGSLIGGRIHPDQLWINQNPIGIEELSGSGVMDWLSKGWEKVKEFGSNLVSEDQSEYEEGALFSKSNWLTTLLKIGAGVAVPWAMSAFLPGVTSFALTYAYPLVSKGIKAYLSSFAPNLSYSTRSWIKEHYTPEVEQFLDTSLQSGLRYLPAYYADKKATEQQRAIWEAKRKQAQQAIEEKNAQDKKKFETTMEDTLDKNQRMKTSHILHGEKADETREANIQRGLEGLRDMKYQIYLAQQGYKQRKDMTIPEKMVEAAVKDTMHSAPYVKDLKGVQGVTDSLLEYYLPSDATYKQQKEEVKGRYESGVLRDEIDKTAEAWNSDILKTERKLEDYLRHSKTLTAEMDKYDQAIQNGAAKPELEKLEKSIGTMRSKIANEYSSLMQEIPETIQSAMVSDKYKAGYKATGRKPRGAQATLIIPDNPIKIQKLPRGEQLPKYERIPDEPKYKDVERDLPIDLQTAPEEIHKVRDLIGKDTQRYFNRITRDQMRAARKAKKVKSSLLNKYVMLCFRKFPHHVKRMQ